MSAKIVQPKVIYSCDLCDATYADEGKTQINPTFHPPTWTLLTIGRHALDYQGAAVGDGTVKRLLCDKCAPPIIEAINTFFQPKEQPDADS